MSRPHYYPNPSGGGDDPYANAPNRLTAPWPEESHNVRRVGHSDLNGWGDAFQIQVGGGICYVAASGTNGHDGVTVLDVSDPANPRVVSQIVGSPGARMHKVLRINDEVMITNSELRRDRRDQYPDLVGGLRVFDTSDPWHPRFVRDVVTDGFGIHRPVYDAERQLLYSSGHKDGFTGMILLVHDMRDPWNPELIGYGWVPGQKEGEEPSWAPAIVGRGARLHEGHPWGHYVTCGYWDAGIALFDLTDPRNPQFVWRHNPHETHGWAGCYHTFFVPPGSEFAIVTQESTTIDCAHPPGHVTFYDMRNPLVPLPISTFMPFEMDVIEMRPRDPRWCKTGSWHGCHNINLNMTADDLLYVCWFNAGLRVVDWSNPFKPFEVGHYLPPGNEHRGCPQSNDVRLDRDTGLIYLTDRWGLGLDILEYTG